MEGKIVHVTPESMGQTVLCVFPLDRLHHYSSSPLCRLTQPEMEQEVSSFWGILLTLESHRSLFERDWMTLRFLVRRPFLFWKTSNIWPLIWRLNSSTEANTSCRISQSRCAWMSILRAFRMVSFLWAELASKKKTFRLTSTLLKEV